MEKEVINKIHELNGKELAIYIDALLKENDPKLMGNKDVLVAIAERLNNFGYQYHVIRGKFREIGLNMNDELEKVDYERTMEFLDSNPELANTLDVVAKWWISVIREPYFANFDNKQISLDMAMYFQLDYSEKKVRENNNKALTPEKEEKFKEALKYEVADEIRKKGYCELKADNFGFDILAKALQKANLKLAFPKKIDMIVESNQVKLASSRGSWDVVYYVDTEMNTPKKK